MQLSICEFRPRVADNLSGVWQEPAMCTSPQFCYSSNMATTGWPANTKRSSRLGDANTPAAVQSEQRRKSFLLRQIACATSEHEELHAAQNRHTGAHLLRKGCSPDAPSTTTVGTTESSVELISVIAIVCRSALKLCPMKSLPFAGGSSCDDTLMR